MPSLADLIRMGKQYVTDALPGGALNREVTRQDVLDGLAMAASPIPVVGDMIGLGADANRYATDPSSRTTLNYGLSALGAIPFMPPMAGIFVGKGAKTWDAVAMGRAQQLAKEGADPRTIWKETGTWQGPDGHWRQEIPDNTVTLDRALFDKIRNADEVYSSKSWPKKEEKIAALDYKSGFGEFMDRLSTRERNTLNKLRETDVLVKKGADVAPHSGLNAAYPTMDNRVVFDSSLPLGTAQEAFGRVSINRGGAADSDIVSQLLHERQHRVQSIEGFYEGGSPSDMFPDSVINKIIAELRASPDSKYFAESDFLPQARFLAYQRLPGEAEARATQSRMNMDAAQRREVFPADSYDVPLDQLIFKDGNGMRSLKDLLPK